jgi:hypothetical protein
MAFLQNHNDAGIEIDQDINHSEEHAGFGRARREMPHMESSTYCCTKTYSTFRNKKYCGVCLNLLRDRQWLVNRYQLHFRVPSGFHDDELCCSICKNELYVICHTDVCLICNNVANRLEREAQMNLEEVIDQPMEGGGESISPEEWWRRNEM